MFQKRHHGIEIPEPQQPKCRGCGCGMSLNIMYPNDKCIAFWYCLECDNGCEEEFEQLSFQNWLEQYPVSQEIRAHFSTVGVSYSELQVQKLENAGYTKMGGHMWGGGFWGEAEGEKFWTGHKGECMEYWLPPAPGA